MMVCTLIFVILIIALILILVNKKLGTGILIVAIVGYWLAGSGIVPWLLFQQLEMAYTLPQQPEWQQRNAIILLGAGTVRLPSTGAVYPAEIAYARILKTAQLYRACKEAKKSCVVIVSGGDVVGTGKSEAEVYRDELVNLGVNPADIKKEENSKNTYQNAEFCSEIIRANNFKQIYLVTSSLHLKRALLYFANFKIYPIPQAADYLQPNLSLLPLEYNFILTDFALHEYIGIAKLYWYNFMGWNKEVSAYQ